MKDQDNKDRSPQIRQNQRESLKKRIFHMIQIGQKDDPASRFCDFVIIAAIILNITVLILGTFDQLKAYQGCFRLNIGTPRAVLQEALERISAAME